MERARVSYERARLLVSKRVVAAQEEQDLGLALEEAKARYQKSLRDCDLVKVDLKTNTFVEIFLSSLSSTRFANCSDDWKVAYLVAHLSWDEVITTLARVEERSSAFFIDVVGDATYPRGTHA